MHDYVDVINTNDTSYLHLLMFCDVTNVWINLSLEVRFLNNINLVSIQRNKQAIENILNLEIKVIFLFLLLCFNAVI